MKRKPYVSCYLSPDRGAASTVVGFIDRTEKTLDIAVFAFTHPDIEAAVVRAKDRGVKVRVILDAGQAAGRGSAYPILQAAGVDVKVDTISGLMHHKLAISDNKVMILGSFNWSVSADKKNAEDMVIVRLTAPIKVMQEEFERLWNDCTS